MSRRKNISSKIKQTINDNMIKSIYYHGTSTKLNIRNKLLPPIDSNVLREHWRTKHLDKVFCTNSLVSANKYAKKAVSKYGGKPIVYLIKPNGLILNINTNEYICDSATIFKKIKT